MSSGGRIRLRREAPSPGPGPSEPWRLLTRGTPKLDSGLDAPPKKKGRRFQYKRPFLGVRQLSQSAYEARKAGGPHKKSQGPSVNKEGSDVCGTHKVPTVSHMQRRNWASNPTNYQKMRATPPTCCHNSCAARISNHTSGHLADLLRIHKFTNTVAMKHANAKPPHPPIPVQLFGLAASS